MTRKNGKTPEVVKNHEVVFEPPTDESPGYLRLQKNVLKVKDRMDKGEYTAEMIDEVIELLLPFVVEPVDRDEAREAMLDISKKQYQQMLNAVVGKPIDEENGEVAVEVVPPAS